MDFHRRLKVLYDGMMEVMGDCAPDIVAIESVFHYRNVMSMLKLGQARGVLMLAAANFNLPLVEYSPKEVKAAVTGNGNAAKEQVQQAVMADLGLQQPSRFDVTDALAVAICHCHRMRF
jgi:crossover junction endodeoxyribonuclease RuvC